jgi:hypothetical protein
MGRPTTACACGQQVRITIAGQVQTVTCGRGEGHPNAHQGKVSWTPRPAPPPKR